ncbi:MAG: toll/interleukin-1 receptor domain-containing protein, partial [Lachnospiraceae bacterium]|nr:toll/interleukin-1 receptor domain-containing protein [Lachnospiraceae bacterium]
NTDYNDKEIYRCKEYVQLVHIPQFTKEYMQEEITDVLLLTTKETRKNSNQMIKPAPDKSSRTYWSPLGYYKTWLKQWFPNVRVHDIDLNVLKPHETLSDTIKLIRELYQKVEDKENWRLWFDTHGGFRDIATVLVSAARFFAVDEKEPIKTNGIFGVLHSQDKNKTDIIINQTAYYFSESAKALKDFLNYGQYLQVQFEPYEGEEKYAFISYKHDNKTLIPIRNLFARFNEEGIKYWFDYGIQYNENWKKKLKERNRNSELFIALLSKSYFDSPECWKELLLAMSVKKPYWEKLHWVMLEGIGDIKVMLEKIDTDEMIEAKKLPEQYDISKEDLYNAFGYNLNRQYLRWYEFANRTDTITGATLENSHIHNAMEIIKNKMEKNIIKDGLNIYQESVFINCSNHPSVNWSDKQIEAAEKFGNIIDIPFPDVDPELDEEKINFLAEIYCNRILQYKKAVVMVQGEYTFSFALVSKLIGMGITVVACCSKRIVNEKVLEDGTTQKIINYDFVKFRKYFEES